MKEEIALIQQIKDATSMPGLMIHALKSVPADACKDENGEDVDEVNVFTPALFGLLIEELRGNRFLSPKHKGILSSDEPLNKGNYPFVDIESDERPDLVFTSDNNLPIFIAEIKMSGNPDALDDLKKLSEYRSKYIKNPFYHLYFIYVNMTIDMLKSKIREADMDTRELAPDIVCFCLNDGNVEWAELKQLFE